MEMCVFVCMCVFVWKCESVKFNGFLKGRGYV